MNGKYETASGGYVRAAKLAPVRMMSTVPSVRPWLMSDSLPSEEAGHTCPSYLPLVRFLMSSPAHTDHLWNGSEVSYTCALLSLVCACAAPNGAAAAAT